MLRPNVELTRRPQTPPEGREVLRGRVERLVRLVFGKDIMGMFRVPYRWLPSTFLRNTRSLFYSVTHGLMNIIQWTPVIWHDEDYDGDYLLQVMEWKLRKMSKHFRLYERHIGWEKDAQEMLVCAEAIRRIRADDFSGDNIHKNYFSTEFYFKNFDSRQKGFSNILFKIMNRRKVGWWG